MRCLSASMSDWLYSSTHFHTASRLSWTLFCRQNRQREGHGPAPRAGGGPVSGDVFRSKTSSSRFKCPDSNARWARCKGGHVDGRLWLKYLSTDVYRSR